MDKITLISDHIVLQIPIKENNEAMVELSGHSEIMLDGRKKRPNDFQVRQAVLTKLLEAHKHLPVGMRFLVVESLRPLSLQKEYFDGYSDELRKLHPDWNKERIYAEANKYVAPPEITPPHSTGGAIDLTLCDKDGKEIDMGTRLNADPEESNNACFTAAENISDEAKQNRKMLIETMESVGFVNYPTEWWHWSYGDRYWAYQTKSSNAIYNSI